MTAGGSGNGLGTWMDPHGLDVLDRDVARDRLASVPFGRVGYAREGRSMIVPVNHVVDGWDVAFRSSFGGRLQEAAAEHTVVFEADHYDPETGGGWSVLAWGPLTIVRDRDVVERLEALGLETPAPGARAGRWTRLRIEDISGRELRPGR